MMGELLENSPITGLILGAVLVLISIMLLNWRYQPTMDAVEWQEEIYYTKEGDSLWSIADKHCPGTVDRREWIDEVKALNRLEGRHLQPYQHIVILTTAKEATDE